MLSSRIITHYKKYSLIKIFGEKEVDEIIKFLTKNKIVEIQYHYNCYCVKHDFYSEDTEEDGLWLSQKDYNNCYNVMSLSKEERNKLDKDTLNKLIENFYYPQIPCCYSSEENEITNLTELENYDRILLKLIQKPDYKLDEI